MMHSTVAAAIAKAPAARLHHLDRVEPEGSVAHTIAAERIVDAEVYRAWQTAPDGTPAAQPGYAIVSRAAGRIAVEWGGDWAWADIYSAETAAELVEMYLSDGEAFEARA